MQIASSFSINSLASFHDTFNIFYKEKFSAESLFENCCDVFEKHIQHKVDFSPDGKDGNYFVKEDLQDTIDDRKDDCIAVDALDLVLDAPTFLDLNGKDHVYDQYKEQVLHQHIVVGKSDKHNSSDEGYQ